MFKKKGLRPHLDKEWEKSHTTIKKHYKHIIFPLGGLALAGVTATAIFLPLYIKSKYEDGLGNFIDEGGTVPAYQKDKPLTYVALGDSITAGYNGFFHGSDQAPESKDYISYADFLAQDLKNAGMLKDYKNYAKSGATIWDTNELVDESQAVNHAIKDADLITISISSNDLLGAATVLGLPFATNLNNLLGNVQLPNHIRDAIHPGSNTGIGGSDKNALIAGALKKAVDLLYNGDVSGVLDMRDGDEKIVLDIIKRGLMILTRDMHQAAPKAHIKYIMPEFPLLGISKKVENNPTPVTGKSVKEYFETDFFNAVKEGIKSDYTSFDTFDNAFVSYIKNIDPEAAKLKSKIDSITTVLDKSKDVHDKFYYAASNIQGGGYPMPAGLVWTKPKDIPNIDIKASDLTEAQLKSIFLSTQLLDELGIDKDQSIVSIRTDWSKKVSAQTQLLGNYQAKYDQYKGVQDRYKSVNSDRTRTIITNEFMNDFADIHPSTRGHQVMGNYLFDKILPLITTPTKTMEEMYQFAVPFKDDGKIENFEELDQIDWTKSTINKELHLKNDDLDGSTIATLSRGINQMITQNPDGDKSPLSSVLKIVKPLLGGDATISSDVYTIDLTQQADQMAKVKGATPGMDIQGFLAALIKGKSSTADEIKSDDKFWVSIATVLNQELVVSPDAAQNLIDLHTTLEKFDSKNNFKALTVSGGAGTTALKEILSSNGITADGDYAGSKVIDWTKVDDKNAIKVEYLANTYLNGKINTLAELLNAMSRSRTLSNITVFLKGDIPLFLSDLDTDNSKGLQTIYERAIDYANQWGLKDLATQLTVNMNAKNFEDKLFEIMAKHTSFSVSQLTQGKASYGLATIVNLATDDVNKGADKTKNALAVTTINDALAKYTAALVGKGTDINEGFKALFNLLNI